MSRYLNPQTSPEVRLLGVPFTPPHQVWLEDFGCLGFYHLNHHLEVPAVARKQVPGSHNDGLLFEGGPLPGCNRGKWRFRLGSQILKIWYSWWSLLLWRGHIQLIIIYFFIDGLFVCFGFLNKLFNPNLKVQTFEDCSGCEYFFHSLHLLNLLTPCCLEILSRLMWAVSWIQLIDLRDQLCVWHKWATKKKKLLLCIVLVVS